MKAPPLLPALECLGAKTKKTAERLCCLLASQVREGKRPADWQKLAVAGKYTLPEGSLTPPKL